jgi:hypothetical protein
MSKAFAMFNCFLLFANILTISSGSEVMLDEVEASVTQRQILVRFQVLAAASMKITEFWDTARVVS